MGKRDKRVDAYIADAADFAKPILMEIRERMHAACPDVEETLKWSHPHFVYHGMLCGMSSFKEHCGLGFWKAALIEGAVSDKSSGAAGTFGRLTSVKDLPPKKIMAGFIEQAMKLNEEGITVPKARAVGKTAAKKTTAPKVPPSLAAALNRNRKALDTFDAFSPSHRKEYIEWIADAKTDATRERRIEQAIEMMTEGKSRHWKYQK